VRQYRFVTIWRLQAPIERVFAEIDAVDAWPEWWPNVRRVEKLEDGDADGIGAAFATTFVGRLPYPLRFDLRVTRREPPRSVVGDATGELEGVGEWTLWEEGGLTLVRYVWAIRTAMKPRYTADVERSGRWWAITVPELRGVHTQSRTLDGVEPMVREAIAVFLDVGEDTFDVEVREALEPEVERVVREAILARSAAFEQQRTASAKARAAVMVLRHRGLPQRDIGRLLKLSHQRVAQLLDSTAR